MFENIKLYFERRKLRPFFDAQFYLSAYPDVAEAGMDPLTHYIRYGSQELRNPFPDFNTRSYLDLHCDLRTEKMNPLLHFIKFGRHRSAAPEAEAEGAVEAEAEPVSADILHQRLIAEHFDPGFYLETYGDVREAGMDPLEHYLAFGAAEGRNPVRYFHCQYYLKNNPDVASNGMNPFIHYLQHGREERRKPSSPILNLLHLLPVTQPWQSPMALDHDLDISVIIPTYNRAERLPSLFEAWKVAHRNTRYRYELIFSDDGSEDGTIAVLEAEAAGELPITVLRNVHGGASSARNAAVRAARGAKVLFLGDDIYPAPNLINDHIEKLRDLPITAAVLGECGWHPDLDVNHLMCHITEIGCEQFSFLNLPRNGYTDFRHFYTCNISIDREFLLSEQTLFDEKFYKYGFEDVELGYRLGLKGMQVFYFPPAYGDHHHSYADVAKFCHRQKCAGEMALVFEKIHPELADLIPLARWHQDGESWLAGGGASTFDFLGVLTGLCQQIENRLPELDSSHRSQLSQAYTKLFQFCFELGYIQVTLPGFTRAAANDMLAERFITETVKQGLDAIHAVLTLDGYDEFDQAWRARPQAVTPMPAPSEDRMAQRQNFVVEAEDMDHLNRLRSVYADFGDDLLFALKSDVRPGGLVYSPAPDAQIGCSNIAQLLLFNRANPQVDMIVLSYGLHDLPDVGVCKGAAPTVLTRSGPVKQGKVIRIYEGTDIEPVPFERALGNSFLLSDTYGNFVGMTHDS